MKTISPGSQRFFFFLQSCRHECCKVLCNPCLRYLENCSKCQQMWGRLGAQKALWETLDLSLKKFHLTSLLAFLQFLKGPWQMDTSNPNHPLPSETELEMNEAFYSSMTLVTRGKGLNRNSPVLLTVSTPLTASSNAQMMLWFSRWQAERSTWKKDAWPFMGNVIHLCRGQ